ncbi:MAG TPA: diaminopimelate decarboxylase [Phaeodactylibacter sp.]|nr:diaminopimelate decarboxylase [Phaeodactylibacter sp.]
MELINRQFQLNEGIDPLALCDQYGTPLFVYDTTIIARQYRRMQDAFKVSDLRIHYACKALPNISILKWLQHLGAGLDTVSIQEVWLGLKAGFSPEKIMYTPNGVSMEEIELALKEGVHITIDNISILEEFGHLHPDVPVAIRINPHLLAGGTYKISTGHIDSKFGISIHQMPLVHRILKTTGLRVAGLHMHTGSDILDAEVFLRGAEILFNYALDFPDLKFIDFGSGFKVAYKKDDIATDIEMLGEKLSARFNDFCESYGRDLSLVFEPGKFLVSEAGYFFAKVNVVKQTISTIFAAVDTGLNHLIRPMFYDAYHEISNISKPQAKKRIYTVVGYICETDTFAVNRKINEISQGDILCFHNAGAYCYAMASNYNARFRPAEVLLHQGKHYLIRQRETMEDLLHGQIIKSF